MYFRSIAPNDLAEVITNVAHDLTTTGQQMTPAAALYCEKRGGFQCGTCCYARPVNATHGKCTIVQGTIHLTEGCCAAWFPDEKQLHLYRQPASL